jgi:tripartite-type tricarboxylate transporter receptor subunit TctC
MKSRLMRIFQVSLFGLAFGISGMTNAQTYPSRTVKLVIPFSAGATADTLGRLIARDMAENLGQSVVVENKAGGGSTIGAASVARSAPDGYTVLFGSGSTHTVAPVVIKAMTYDPEKDFQPIGLVGSSSYVLVVNPKLPFNTLAELIDYGCCRTKQL